MIHEIERGNKSQSGRAAVWLVGRALTFDLVHTHKTNRLMHKAKYVTVSCNIC